MFEAKNLALGYQRGQKVLEEITFSFDGNAITTIIGPNGCGKTTLLKSLSRLLQPLQGEVKFNNEPVRRIGSKQFARQVAFLPQSPQVPDDFSVYDLVALGRFPYQSWLGRMNDEDHQIVQRSIELTGVEALMHRKVSSLSGGERQRAYIAMALAQQPRVFLLDEPITYLDINHQLEVLELLTHLNRKLGIMIVMVLHNLDLALRYADEVLVLNNHRIYAYGKPDDIITSQLCDDVFGIDARFIQSVDLPHRVFVPLRQSGNNGHRQS